MQCARPGPLGLPKLVLRLGNSARARSARTSGKSGHCLDYRPRSAQLTFTRLGGRDSPRQPCQNRVQTRRVGALGVSFERKQIPQIVENSKKCGELLEPLEGDGMRPREPRGFQGSIGFREILTITASWGICFRSTSSPSGSNRCSSDAVLAQLVAGCAFRINRSPQPGRRCRPARNKYNQRRGGLHKHLVHMPRGQICVSGFHKQRASASGY
jgi:hypothetical protein